jgi:hypothetical protein
VVVRVRTAGFEPFSTGAGDVAAQLTRVNDAAPALPLVDQHGRELSLDEYRGRPVLVAFAYAHCATVCPLIVSDVLEAQRRHPSARRPYSSSRWTRGATRRAACRRWRRSGTCPRTRACSRAAPSSSSTP